MNNPLYTLSGIVSVIVDKVYFDRLHSNYKRNILVLLML
jgi:hypothetical protein